MTTWVDRIGSRQRDIQAELDKLRKKYEREEQPPEEFPKGFKESRLRKWESLFPELRETDKLQKPEVSPEMARPFNPFRREEEAPSAEPWWMSPFKTGVPPLTSERVSSSMFMCRPTSTSLGERIHMAQSLVGKVLSN